jgi:hypothetical protein
MSPLFKESPSNTAERAKKIMKLTVVAAIAGAALTGCAVANAEPSPATSHSASPEATADASKITSSEFEIKADQTPEQIAQAYVDKINKLYNIEPTKKLSDEYFTSEDKKSVVNSAAEPYAETAADGLLGKDWRNNPTEVEYVHNRLEETIASSLNLKLVTDPKLASDNKEEFSSKQTFQSVTSESPDAKTLKETITTIYTSNYLKNEALQTDSNLKDIDGKPVTTQITFDLSSGYAVPTSVTVN